MKHFLHKSTGLLLAVIMLLTTLSMSSLAAADVAKSAAIATQAQAANTPDGNPPLSISIAADKGSYTLLSTVKFNVTVTNTSNAVVSNVSAEALFGSDLAPLANGSQITAEKASLAPGESLSFSYNAKLINLKWLDILLFPLQFIFNLFKGSSLPVTDNGFNDGRAYEQARENAKLLSLFNSAYDASTTVKAYYISGADIMPSGEISLGDIENLISANMIEVIRSEDASFKVIDGMFTSDLVTSESDAADVLNNAKALFGSSYDYFEANDISAQANENDVFYRYNATINGIPVYGSQIILSTTDNGKVSGLFSTYDREVSQTNTIATITQSQAETSAKNAFIQEFAMLNSISNSEAITILNGKLEVFSSLLIYAIQPQTPTLAYEVFVIKAPDAPEGTSEEDDEMLCLNKTYYVYANDDIGIAGEIFASVNASQYVRASYRADDLNNKSRVFDVDDQLFGYEMHDIDRKIKTYNASNNANQAPAFLYTFGLFGGSPSKAAVSAHANMADVYDFYLSRLGRKSFDEKGADVKIIFDTSGTNAAWSWNPVWGYGVFQFSKKNNYAAGLDVVGHEFTHAVIQYIMGGGKALSSKTLGGTYESSGLNEAYCDILGNLIENKTGEGRWQIGEDTSSVIRTMNLPVGSPFRYYGGFGGVDSFCQNFGFAAYRMMTDSRTINSVSNITWAKIFYDSLFRLSNDAKFLDARGAIIAVAKTRLNAAQVQAIRDAFDFVGIVEADSIRIVLRWGATPSDLDSHLTGPSAISGGSRFHIYFGERNYYANGSYYSSTAERVADLDYDHTSAYGPEVTTIRKLTPGDYYFYVHDYTNNGSNPCIELANSSANVKVYRGSGTTNLLANYNVSPSRAGTLWTVCKLTISSSGNITITPINTYSYQSTDDVF